MGSELTREIESKCFTLRVDDIGLKVYDSGRERSYETEKVLVFLHGSPGQISNWKYQIAYLREKYRVVAYDQRGYGGSDKPEVVCLEDYLRDLDSLLDKLGIAPEKSILIGHSFGGMIAQAYAAERRIMGLVLIGSLVKYKPDTLDKIIWYLPAVLWKPILFKKNPLTVRLYRSVFFSSKTPDNIFEDFMEDNTEYIESLPAHVYRYSKYYRDYDASTLLKEIKCPTLIVVGEDDKVTPPDYSREIAELIPQSKLVIVKDAGHLVLYEKAEEINRLIEEFIETL